MREPSDEHVRAIQHLCASRDATAVAERTRRRAAKLYRSDFDRGNRILNARDKLILAIYGSALPDGWFSAWCDGSSMASGRRRVAGIGGLITDSDGEIVARVAQSIGRVDAFEAEIAALAAVLQTGLELGVERIGVHTDCKALALLWQRQRGDPRLAPTRTLAYQFRRVGVRLVPRQHNQPANALARRAVPAY